MTDAAIEYPRTRDGAGDRASPVIYTLTIFLSAALLFFVQPLFAKMALPVIGGSPAVWTTAMLFFQSVLIAGYLYAHLSARYLPVKAQIAVHMALWAAALWFLPPDLPDGWQLAADRAVPPQTLWLFAMGVGVPFALLSSNAPLIQSWYPRTGGPSAEDPYFLYGASNLGSFMALLAFPLVAEPLFGASDIARGFSAGFVVLGTGLAACGWRIGGGVRATAAATVAATRAAPAPSDYARWLVLAFVPSSLMLAVTTKIGADLGALPLVWVIPLALYLLTFVLTFSERTPIRGRGLAQAARLTAVLALCLFTDSFGAQIKAPAMLALVLCFAVIACWCHRALYDQRPAASHLTAFYVTMSVGGALGGLFNSIVGPVLFGDLHEGTLTVIAALALLFAPALGLTGGVALKGILAGGLVAGAGLAAVRFAGAEGLAAIAVLALSGVGLAAILRRQRPVLTTALATLALVFAAFAAPDPRLFNDRSFFGLHQVADREGVRYYSNGTTIHGAQPLAGLGTDRPVPTAYYHPANPLGQVFLSQAGQDARRIGIVGLGVGALACYARDHQAWEFYEIDLMVDRVARDDSLFTYLSHCTPEAPTHLGDARIVLEGQSDTRFDILVIDAYSSDAVPVHLTTVEAMALYLHRLAPGGVLLFHISNRYYDIDRPLARSAAALGAAMWTQRRDATPEDGPGIRSSEVAMIARDPAHVADLLAGGLWSPALPDGGEVWTDDKANPLSILLPGALR